jgi:fluoroquinolone resistance protein
MDCRFEKCNLSLVKMVNTGMKNIRSADTRIAGVDFSTCNNFLFALGFEGCSIKETDFSEADLTEALFERCDLSGNIFRQTKLEKADFRTALRRVTPRTA